ncbi:sag-related sequence srs33 [Cystoisospora suis]|uniref:Sag-related sequence srs33 n=1 Tax=Cystoisospora suis TaxID=483139 RepID=A0A2C6KMQ6_9APIC|nr:sag-related sequence srs33 [Cystoisospora suis]
MRGHSERKLHSRVDGGSCDLRFSFSKYSLLLFCLFLSVIAQHGVAGTAGINRKVSIESCDLRTQKLVMTVNPGDKLQIRCAGAVSPIPRNIEKQCCQDAFARCSPDTLKNYEQTFPSAPAGFVFAQGDGINLPWSLKIPENAQAPYPTLSVGWYGSEVPSSSTQSVARPQTTLVLRVEPPLDEEIIATITSTISRKADAHLLFSFLTKEGIILSLAAPLLLSLSLSI